MLNKYKVKLPWIMPDLFGKGSEYNKRDLGLDTYFIFIIIISGFYYL